MSEVRVRFAPSPTGYLHVGGARTALFNYLFARHHNGTFVLRIEDTDETRSTDESVREIFAALRWLGLQWDEGPETGGAHAPYFQSQRGELYRHKADELVERGNAYYCFCTKEELDAERERAAAEKRPPRYSGKCRCLTFEEMQTKRAKGEPAVVRFRVPPGRTSFVDLIRGEIAFDHTEIDDFIIMKSTGGPVYNFSVTIDDIEMGITHVIRGDDGISNTPRQILICRALGAEVPHYGHVPLINGPDGRKLSKRHGEVSVLNFARQGYLSEAMFNFLSLIGWSPGDNREIMTKDEIIKQFSLDGVGKSSGIFDYKKLVWMNGQYLRALPIEELVQRIIPPLQEAGFLPADVPADMLPWLRRLAEATRERLSITGDIIPYSDFFFRAPEQYEDKGVQKHWKKPNAVETLRAFREIAAACEPFTVEALESRVEQFITERGIKLGDVVHPARLAVTGKTVGPGFFDTVVLLGREETLARLDRAITYIEEQVAVK